MSHHHHGDGATRHVLFHQFGLRADFLDGVAHAVLKDGVHPPNHCTPHMAKTIIRVITNPIVP